MEACIEALYTIDGESDKRKTLEMIRVLKGAISVSKSRTGQVIYHYNRHEKKALGKTMAKFDKDTKRSKVNIDSQKRDVLRKWSLVFGRQRRFTESLRGFDNMLTEALSTRRLTNEDGEKSSKGKDEGDDKEEEDKKDKEGEEEEEKQTKGAAEDVPKMPQITDPRRRRVGAWQQGSTPGGVVATPAMVGVLPKLTTAGSLHNARIETEEEERERLEKQAEEERQRKKKQLPRFDKALMETYLTEQRTLHEDLLTRNKLMRIRTTLDKDHAFFKHRLQTRLPDTAPDLLHTLRHSTTGALSERTASAVTWAGPPSTITTVRCRSRQAPPSSKSGYSNAGGGGGGGGGGSAVGGGGGKGRDKVRVVLTARVSSPSPPPHPSTTTTTTTGHRPPSLPPPPAASPNPLHAHNTAQLQQPSLERAKTVHFS